jgi:hypothetical protein
VIRQDSFHHFDRHTGRVHLEDLGVGLIERLQGLASNDALLRTVAREIVPSGKKRLNFANNND